MIIERNKNEIIFKIAADTNIDELQEYADLLKVKELSRKSKVSQRKADELAKMAKKGRWQKTKARLDL